MTRSKTALIAFLVLAPLAGVASAQSEETEIPGVTATLAYAHQSSGVLRVGILLKNITAREIDAAKGFSYEEAFLIEAKSRRKQFALKGPNGHFLAGPTSDWDHGGRWFARLAPNSETLQWFLFDAVAPGSKVTIQVPLLQPFDDVTVVDGVAKAIADVSGPPPIRLSVVSATRTSGQMKVRLKVADTGTQIDSGSHPVYYEDVLAFDPPGKRTFAVLKDTEGSYLAQPVGDRDHGGRWFLQSVAPGGQAFMNLTFDAPPDSVRQIDILVPWFGPIEAVPIAGEGGAVASGAGVSGKALGLEAALQDLKADVTAQQIKVSLAADLLFDFDKADIKPDAEPSLAKVVTVLQANPGAALSVEGHADGKGADAYNQALSLKRAGTVAQWLATHANLAAASVHTQGWGKSKPVAPNTKPDGSDDPVGRAKNRRVEIIINRS